MVQRPASVVKELLDNAIDSGSDHISVVLQHSGRTMIQVCDNGCGMSAEDIKLCFLRHATSKITSVEELQGIRTLGFRGEAMASIASVAQVTVTSKRVEDETGTEYEIRGGEEIRLEPAAADNGTTVTVRNLFYNVPARRAFLKTDATEFRHILLAFHQAAIAHPEIRFDLDAGGEIIYRLHIKDLETRISELFGASYKASLIPVKESTSLVRISGLLSDPKLAKKTRGEQFLFINRRPFYHRHLNYIIQEIYRDWIQPGQYPFYALFLEVEPEMVDVNVHPTKQEIKFEDERTISTFTRSVVKKSLHAHMQVPAWDPGTDESERFADAFRYGFGQKPSQQGGSGTTRPSESFRKEYHGFRKEYPGHNIGARLYGPGSGSAVDPGGEITPPSPGEGYSGSDTYENKGRASQKVGDSGFTQIHHQYILSQTRNGLFFMDQHAAHKRIIYEKVLSEADSGLPSTQQLLFPKNINFSATDFSLLKELQPVITRMGFNIQLLSGNSAMILGVPSDIRLDNEQHVLESIMEQYKSMTTSLKLDEKERVALALANKAAIPRGKKLSAEEMEALFDQLFACDEPFKDPLGKPTIRPMSLDELKAMFR